MAASSTKSAASRYLPNCTAEMSSAALALSKPSSRPSSGSISRTCSPGRAKRSRMVLSYSARFRRRMATRPYWRWRCVSAAESPVARALSTVSRSAADGWSAFFGGISPARTRSCTFTQRAKVSASAKSVFNAVRSRLPFFVSESWQSMQRFSMNELTLVGGSAAEACRTATIGRPRPRKMESCRIMFRAGKKLYGRAVGLPARRAVSCRRNSATRCGSEAARFFDSSGSWARS